MDGKRGIMKINILAVCFMLPLVPCEAGNAKLNREIRVVVNSEITGKLPSNVLNMRVSVTERLHTAIINNDYKTALSYIYPNLLPLSETQLQQLKWCWDMLRKSNSKKLIEVASASGSVNGIPGYTVTIVAINPSSIETPLVLTEFWLWTGKTWYVVPSLLGELALTVDAAH